jgi:hypothetical protein
MKNGIIFTFSGLLGLGMSNFWRSAPASDPQIGTMPEIREGSVPVPESAFKDSTLAGMLALGSVEEVLAELESMREEWSVDRRKRAFVSLLVARAATMDPEATLSFLLQPNSQNLRHQGYPALLNVWVNEDAQGAVDKITSLERGAVKRELEMRLLNALAEQAPEMAWGIIVANKVGTGEHSAVGVSYQAFLHWARQDFDAANAEYSRISDPSVKEIANRALVAARVNSDPAGAFDWASSLPGDRESASTRALVFSLGLLADGEAAFEFIESRLEEEGGKEKWGFALQRMISIDPDRTISLIERMDSDNKEAVKEHLSSMVSHHPEKVISIIEEKFGPDLTGSSHEAFGIRATYFEALSQMDPQRALEWFRTNGEDAQAGLTRGVTRLLRGLPPESAAVFVQENLQPEKQAEALGSILGRWGHSDDEEAMRWLDKSVHDASLRQELAEKIEMSAASGNPSGFAPKVLDRTDTPANRKIVETIAFRLAVDDPVNGANWADAIADPQLRERAVVSVVIQWLDQDSMAAGEWISQMSPGRTRDQAAKRLIEAIGEVDPEGAKEWEATLEQEK